MFDRCVGIACIFCCSVKDINERAALEQQIMEFGQTPKQLFTHPHPRRLPTSDVTHTTLGPSDAHTDAPCKNVDVSDDDKVSLPSDAIDSRNVTNDVCKASHENSVTSAWFDDRNALQNATVTHTHHLHKSPATRVLWNDTDDIIYSVGQGAHLC